MCVGLVEDYPETKLEIWGGQPGYVFSMTGYESDNCEICGYENDGDAVCGCKICGYHVATSSIGDSMNENSVDDHDGVYDDDVLICVDHNANHNWKSVSGHYTRRSEIGDVLNEIGDRSVVAIGNGYFSVVTRPADLDLRSCYYNHPHVSLNHLRRSKCSEMLIIP